MSVNSTDEGDTTFRGWVYARAGDYHKHLDPNWSYTPTYLKKMHYVRCFLAGLPKDEPILDTGCGEGVLVQEFLAEGYKIEGIDLNYASSYVKQENILDMSFYENGRFGAVLLLDVLSIWPSRTNRRL